jgi:hypothetical protein
VVDGCWPEGGFDEFEFGADLFASEKDFSIAYRE